MTRRIIAVAVCLLAGADTADAAKACIWSGNGGIFNAWSLPVNWVNCGNGVPQNGDTVVFNNSTVGTSVNDIQALTLKNIIINGTANESAGPTRWRLNGLVPLTVTGIVDVFSPRDRLGEGPAIDLPLRLSGAVVIHNVPFMSNDRATLRLGNIDLNGASLSLVADAPIAVTGVISGAGEIRKEAPDSVTLAANTYTGITRIVQGTVVLQDSHALGATGVGDYTLITANGRMVIAANVIVDEPLVIEGDNAGNTMVEVATGNAARLAGPINMQANTGFLVRTNAQLSLSGQIGPGLGAGMFKYGPGVLILSNPQSFWFLLRIDAGTVRIGAPGAFPFLAGIEFGSETATFDLNNFDVTAYYVGTPIANNPIGGGIVQLGSGTLTLDGGSDPNTTPIEVAFGGTMTGSGGVVVTGPVREIFTGQTSNSYTGTTTVKNAGGLYLNKSNDATAVAGPIVVDRGILVSSQRNQIAPTAAVTMNGVGIFILDAPTEHIGSLAGDGVVALHSGTLVVGGNHASTTFAGLISGANLQKVGTGTLTLTRDSTLIQATTINGTLRVNGSLPATGFVQLHGGTLSGSGTVGTLYDATTVAPRTAISPGASPGILHAKIADLRNTTMVVELNGLDAGTGYDQLDLAGNVTLSSAASSFVARLQVTRAFAPPIGTPFTIVNVAAGGTITGTFSGLAEGAALDINGQAYAITYHGGDGNDVVLTALTDPAPPPPPPPPPTRTYLLAEGATGSFFDDDVLIANPNDAVVPVTLTFFKENGEQVVATRTLGALARETVHVDQLAGLDATASSVRVTSDSGLPLVVERSMFWGEPYYAGHTGSAIDQPTPDWFFAEGSQGFFDTFVLVVNPNATAADVTFTFLLEDAPPVSKTVALAAFSRLTLDAGSVAEIVDRSFGITVHATQPIMAERSMYFGTTATRLWSGGHESAGVTAPSTHWFLAEGATGGFFDTFVLLSNPQATPAQVTLDYLLDAGAPIRVTKTIPARGRLTTNIEAEGDPRLHDAAVSTVVTSDVPIIAERSMYWPGAAQPWGEGHNSFGVVEAGTRWGLAEGRVGGPLQFRTYILLANPQSTAANVTVTYLREGAAPIEKTYVVPATSRFTIDAGSVDELRDESFGARIFVTNDVPIVVERSLYWSAFGFLFSGGTNATATRVP